MRLAREGVKNSHPTGNTAFSDSDKSSFSVHPKGNHGRPHRKFSIGIDPEYAPEKEA
jgi:hypothetical protein